MYVLSAAEAISPALSRTKRLLFQPFRWSTYLKLCAVAVFTEGLSGNSHFNGNTPAYSHNGPSFAAPAFSAGLISAIIAISIVAIVLGFLIFYLVVRLRFALFHCLVHQTTAISPGWFRMVSAIHRFWAATTAG